MPADDLYDKAAALLAPRHPDLAADFAGHPDFRAAIDLAVRAGREQVAAELTASAELYPPDVFPPDSTSRDAISGTAMRIVYTTAARIAAADEDATDGR